MRWLLYLMIALVVIGLVVDLLQAHIVENLVMALLEDARDAIMQYDCKITYVAVDGSNPPKAQKFKSGSNPTIADEKPTRPGYHFIGWSRVEKKDPEVFPGEKTSMVLNQDTVLYACWEEFNPQSPNTISYRRGKMKLFSSNDRHGYEYQETNHGLEVKIRCGCGLEVHQYNITLDAFVELLEEKSFDQLSKKQQDTYKRRHVLYCAQHYAPAMINMIASFYNSMEISKGSVEASFSTASDILEVWKKGAEFDAKYAQKLYKQEFVDFKKDQLTNANSGETLSYLLHKMRTGEDYKEQRKLAKEFFGTMTDTLEKATNAVSVAQALFYFYDATSQDQQSPLTKTTSMVKSVQAIMSFCPYMGEYYEQLFTVLEEGLKLLKEYHQAVKNYEALLDSYFNDKTLLQDFVLTVDMVDQARHSDFSSYVPSKGQPKPYPTAVEVMDALFGGDPEKPINKFTLMNSTEQTLVVWYLNMRLEHDFQSRFGISLETYASYLS